MVYTCGYWKNAKTLEEAQEAKLDLICKKAGSKPGMRVLDLGCGFGGFAMYAGEKYGCEVLGVTISTEQQKWGSARAKKKGLDKKVELRLQDYRTWAGAFDRVCLDRHDGARRLEEPPQLDGGDPPLSPGRTASPSSTRSARTRARSTASRSSRSTSSRTRPRRRWGSSARRPSELFVIEDVHNIGPDYRPDAARLVEELRGRLPHARSEEVRSGASG
jgi:cyclopropane-fatty-acyl-phospholipid synthase